MKSVVGLGTTVQSLLCELGKVVDIKPHELRLRCEGSNLNPALTLAQCDIEERDPKKEEEESQ